MRVITGTTAVFPGYSRVLRANKAEARINNGTGGYGLGVISEMFLFYLFAQSSQAERIDPPKILGIPVLIPRGKSLVRSR